MMTAEIIILADVRAARARVTVDVSVDAPPLWLAWYAYWTGDKPRAPEKREAVVRSIGGGR